jgi:hypothetical protein
MVLTRYGNSTKMPSQPCGRHHRAELTGIRLTQPIEADAGGMKEQSYADHEQSIVHRPWEKQNR